MTAKSMLTRRNTLALIGAGALSAPYVARAEGKSVNLGYGVSVVDPSTAPWLSAAKTGGFWQAEGVDVKVTGFSGAGPVLQLLANGQLDIVYTGTPEAMKMSEINIPVRCVANSYERNHNYPAVAEDSPIKTIEDFRGKRMGLQVMNGSIFLWEKVLLQTHKLAMSDLASVIPVGTGAPAVNALRTHQIDILGEWHGHYAFLEVVLGLKLRKFDQDPALSQYSFVQGFFVRDQLLQKDPQMVTAVLRGVAQGIRFAIENPAAAVRGHFQQFPNSRPTGMPEDKAVEELAKVVSINVELSKASTLAQHWGAVSPDRIEHVRDALIDNGILHKKLPWQQYFDSRLIESINKYDVDAVVKKAREAA